jgi:hypothetical protein
MRLAAREKRNRGSKAKPVDKASGDLFQQAAPESESLKRDIAGSDQTLPEGFLLDFISGVDHLPDNPKEHVRQRIARALFHEYGICVEDMERDFAISVGGRRRRVDIAIFKHDGPHTSENLRRVVICRAEPKLGNNGAVFNWSNLRVRSVVQQ